MALAGGCILMIAATMGVGCDKSSAPGASNEPALNLPTHAQPKLETMKLWLGAEQLEAELALTAAQQQTGMMFRTNISEQGGMLFVFQVPDRASFWMKNCPLPLSAAYIDPDGVILEIHDLQPENTNTVVADTARIQFVLETSQGWFARHNVSTGAVVRTERGGLAEAFSLNR